MPTVVEEMPLVLPSPTQWEKLLRPGDLSGPYIVILYDDNVHTIDEVIFQVRKATGCGFDKAYAVTMEVHNTGRAIAYAGSKEQCEEVATILREIRLQVETDAAM